MHTLFNTMYIRWHQDIYELYIANRWEVAEAVLGISPTWINVNSFIFILFSFIEMNLNLKSLGLVMVVAPLGCRKLKGKRSKYYTGCEIEV